MKEAVKIALIMIWQSVVWFVPAPSVMPQIVGLLIFWCLVH